MRLVYKSNTEVPSYMKPTRNTDTIIMDQSNSVRSSSLVKLKSCLQESIIPK